MNPTPELQTYIQQCLGSGMTPDAIRQQLLASGWPQPMVDAALYPQQPGYAPQPGYPAPPAKPSDPHKIRKGLLWIFSPFLLLIGIAILQFFVRFASAPSAAIQMINILSILSGIAGVILIPVGLIVGIIKLALK